MSVRHPTISAWQRDHHDGSYTSEAAGFALRVTWTPNSRDARGSFAWTAEHDGKRPHRSHESFEELSAAMADAEEFARTEAARRGHSSGA
ncbi:MAG: hypothetical protein FJ096_19515 [Deltaproteobacteria bacterium]|nr:hypothetical protein [Deltaproteobacteria bacterium]